MPRSCPGGGWAQLELTDALHVPFIELSLAMNIWLHVMQVFFGVVFISYKNENVNKDACHAHYLQQNSTDSYIFRKYIKYTFISPREIIGYIKIMTSRAA